MNHIIRIHLEHKEDVIRNIEISSDKTLEDLHFAVVESLNLDKNEMASFYMTNEDFELLQEIPLCSFDEKDKTILAMNEIKISSVFPTKGSQLLYIYDFLKMWQFLVTFSEESKSESKIIKHLEKVGKMPNDPPEIKFEAEKEFDPFNEVFEDFDEFREYEC